MRAAFLSLAFLWLPGSLAAAVVQSGPQMRSPEQVIRDRNEAVRAILDAEGDDVSPEAKERLKDIINDLMDFRELSRRALGKYWEARTAKERDDFVDVFRQLIRNSSVRKLSIYKADSVTYLAPEIRGDRADVTTLAYKGRKDVEIVYRMHRVGDEWKAYDMVIDGASTARSYRDSFYKKISQTSYEEMYESLVRKLAEE